MVRMSEKKIQTAFRLTPLQLRTIDDLSKELGLNRTQFIAWMLDTVVANWESLKEAEKKRKEIWEEMQSTEVRTDLEKYLEFLRKHELALKITE